MRGVRKLQVVDAENFNQLLNVLQKRNTEDIVSEKRQMNWKSFLS